VLESRARPRRANLRRILTQYLVYYHQARTHLALDKDAPDLRPIEFPAAGRIVQLPEVGGLHHRYVRRAAESATAILAATERAPQVSSAARSPSPIVILV
jgi:hypothetical protein